MERNVFVLKDGTEFILESASGLGEINVLFENKEAMIAGWDTLTKANLSHVQIKSSSGIVLGNHEGLVMGNPVIKAVYEQEDGLLTTFNLREKTEMELLAERMEAVEETTDMLTMEALLGGETS